MLDSTGAQWHRFCTEVEVHVTRNRSVIRLVLVAAVFVVGCGYGMFAERTQRFPFRLTREALSVVRSGRHTPAPAAGRWKRSRQHSDGAELTEEQREELTRLESIGYLTGSVPVGERSGVTVHDEARVASGLNLVVSGHRPWAALMDMNGNVVHEWQLDFRAAWPGREISSDANGDDYWRRIMLLDDGGIVAVIWQHRTE